MTKTIMILGAGLMQLPAFEVAKKRGWRIIAADGNPQAPCASKAHLFLPIDLKDRLGLEQAAYEIQNESGLDGIFTCGTDFSASVAWVSEKLNLPGIPYQRALDCTDKVRMRMALQEKSVSCPSFCDYSCELDLFNETKDLQYPLVVKPVDSMGGRGVVKVFNQEDLRQGVDKALPFSRTDRVIIEEFIDGREFSLDALVYNGEVQICGFADRHVFFPPFFIEMGHTLPTSLLKEDQDKVIKTFIGGIKALGITNGCAKGDIKLSSKGAFVGEIAARLSGGYMSGWTYPYASGVNLVEKGMEIALGLDPGIILEKEHKTSSERAFLSIPGEIERISYLEKAHQLEGVKDIFLRLDEKDRACFPVNNVEKCGNVIACLAEREASIKQAEKAVGTILVELKPRDEETKLFLEENLNSPFPPSAYITKDLPFFDSLKNLKIQFDTLIKLDSLTIPKDKDFLEQKDWNHRSLESTLQELSLQRGLTIKEGDHLENKEESLLWYALLRGGVQGALWVLKSNL